MIRNHRNPFGLRCFFFVCIAMFFNEKMMDFLAFYRLLVL